MKKITMTMNDNSVEEVLEEFLEEKRCAGLSPKTVDDYERFLERIFRNFDTRRKIGEVSKREFEQLYLSVGDGKISPRTTETYGVALRTFLNWASDEDYCDIRIKVKRAQVPPKETYTDEELELLLKKPNLKKCDFPEYRSWVIVNFLMNCGARAGTIMELKIKDVDLEEGLCSYSHTKNKRAQIIPLCTPMRKILKEYLRIRKGSENDYLFPSQEDTQLTYTALRCSIQRYNNRRGVERTSIHAFRHTFAKKYLLDMNGNAFKLQKLLGHTTLEMTRHYCNIYDKDLLKDFDDASPLTCFAQKERLKIQ